MPANPASAMVAGARADHSGGMTNHATTSTPYAAPTRSRPGPPAWAVAGAIAAFFAVALIAGGAALLWVSSHKTDAAGDYTTATHEYSTPTRALPSDSIYVNADTPDWVLSSDSLGRVRIAPRAAASGKPV